MRLPRIFSDHLVLQRDRPVPVWGWGEPGEPIQVTFSGQSVRTTTDRAGKWQVRYAYALNPEGCNLYNRAGLPTSPFRTDND